VATYRGSERDVYVGRLATMVGDLGGRVIEDGVRLSAEFPGRRITIHLGP
jgi:hypothetical protein